MLHRVGWPGGLGGRGHRRRGLKDASQGICGEAAGLLEAARRDLASAGPAVGQPCDSAVLRCTSWRVCHGVAGGAIVVISNVLKV